MNSGVREVQREIRLVDCLFLSIYIYIWYLAMDS